MRSFQCILLLHLTSSLYLLCLNSRGCSHNAPEDSLPFLMGSAWVFKRPALICFWLVGFVWLHSLRLAKVVNSRSCSCNNFFWLCSSCSTLRPLCADLSVFSAAPVGGRSSSGDVFRCESVSGLHGGLNALCKLFLCLPTPTLLPLPLPYVGFVNPRALFILDFLLLCRLGQEILIS